jgi:sec-independent protein translocase protein TatB
VFGIGFFEFIIIAIVIVIFLGPDKLPETIIKVIKTLKALKKTVNEAKSAIEEELNIEELKEESRKYRALLEKDAKNAIKSFSLEEFKELKESTEEVNSVINELKNKTTPKIKSDKTDEEQKSV